MGKFWGRNEYCTLATARPKIGEIVMVLDETTDTVVRAEYDDMSFFTEDGKQLEDAYYWRKITEE